MMKTNQTIFCQHCSCNFNPPELEKCIICGYSLDSLTSDPAPPTGARERASLTVAYLSKQRKSRFSIFSTSVLPALFCLLMSGSLGASFILWQRMEQRIYKPDGFNSFKSEVKLALDSIKIYRSMKKVPAVPEGLFNYNGATSFAALETHGMNKQIISAHPQYQIRYTEPSNNDPPGGGTGLKMLINGELSFAQSGRSIKDSEHAKAKERNFTLEQIPVAIDGLVFFVNPKLPVAALNVEQLKSIFEGKITNWKELGGLDLPIVPISQDPEVHVTVSLLLNNGEKLGDQVKIVRDYTTAMQQVATAAGGISFSPASLVRKQNSIRSIGLAKGNSQNYIFPISDGQVNLQAFRKGSYPITRRMYVIVRHDGKIEEQAGIAYANLLLTKQGQKIIEDAGFVSLY